MAVQKKVVSWLNLPPVMGKLSHMELNCAIHYAEVKHLNNVAISKEE